MRKYLDKNGRQIKAGMTIQHNDGDIEKVYACGDGELGVSASNPKYLEAHPEAPQEFYLLHQFRMREWVIIKEV